jgi:hypothetical protein
VIDPRGASLRMTALRRGRKTFPGKVRRTADPSASLGMTKERAPV